MSSGPTSLFWKAGSSGVCGGWAAGSGSALAMRRFPVAASDLKSNGPILT